MNSPIWMPPLSLKTIATIVFIVAAAQADKLPTSFTNILLHPAMFVILILIAISAFEYNSAPFAIALILLLLSVWSLKKSSQSSNQLYQNYSLLNEGFMPYSPSGTIDWVTEPKKWFVERVMKENPLAIMAKDVKTYPVQTESSSSNA